MRRISGDEVSMYTCYRTHTFSVSDGTDNSTIDFTDVIVGDIDNSGNVGIGTTKSFKLVYISRK